MNKKMMKICTMLVTIMMIISITFGVFAITPSEINGDNANVDTKNITSVGNNIVAVLQTVGVVISVIVLIILGIKYMMGSAEEKAEYKKTMIPYIVGAALIFAASMFAQTVFDFFSGWTL